VRILLVHCHYRLPGGEDAVFAAERAALEAAGHTVLCFEGSNEEAAHGLAKLLLPLRAMYNFGAADKLRALLQKEPVDAVHIHNTLLLFSPSVVRAAKKAGVPVVQTLHNFRLFCPNGIFLREGAVCEDCPHRGLFCAVRHKCYRGSALQSAVVAVCYALHRRLGTYRGITLTAPTDFDREKLLACNRLRPTFDEERLVVLPNPVTVTPFPLLPWPERENQILFAGRLEELKGLPVVLEAWRRLGPQAPKLLVAGSGPLDTWAKENAPDTVEFIGQLNREALHRAMTASRAVVAASLCYETFALVSAEAQLLGTPVLASDIGNIGQSVEPGVTGLRFAPGDASALAEAVRALDGAKFDETTIQTHARARYGGDIAEMLINLYRRAAT